MAVTSAGLRVGTVTAAYSNSIPEGDVIGQNPAAGTSVPGSSAVDLVVSLGTAEYGQDFEAYNAQGNPADWFDTGANNSMVINDSLFKVFDLNGKKAFGTTSTATNIHHTMLAEVSISFPATSTPGE